MKLLLDLMELAVALVALYVLYRLVLHMGATG